MNAPNSAMTLTPCAARSVLIKPLTARFRRVDPHGVDTTQTLLLHRLSHIRLPQSGIRTHSHVNPIQETPPVTAVADNDCVAFVIAPAGPALGGRVTVINLIDAPKVPIQAICLPHTHSDARNALLNERIRST